MDYQRRSPRRCADFACRELRHPHRHRHRVGRQPATECARFPTLRQPARVVLDSRLQTPIESKLVQDGGSPTVIATLVEDESRLAPYRRHEHIRIIRPSETQGRIDLHDLLAQLAALGFGEVMVEAGATLAGAFLQENLADEIVLYQAPKSSATKHAACLRCRKIRSCSAARPLGNTTTLARIGDDIKWVLHRASLIKRLLAAKRLNATLSLFIKKTIPTFVKNSSQLPHSHKLTTVSIISLRFPLLLIMMRFIFILFGYHRGILFQTAFVLKPNPTLLVFN